MLHRALHNYTATLAQRMRRSTPTSFHVRSWCSPRTCPRRPSSHKTRLPARSRLATPKTCGRSRRRLRRLPSHGSAASRRPGRDAPPPRIDPASRGSRPSTCGTSTGTSPRPRALHRPRRQEAGICPPRRPARRPRRSFAARRGRRARSRAGGRRARRRRRRPRASRRAALIGARHATTSESALEHCGVVGAGAARLRAGLRQLRLEMLLLSPSLHTAASNHAHGLGTGLNCPRQGLGLREVICAVLWPAR